jgi:hypothetical protein
VSFFDLLFVLLCEIVSLHSIQLSIMLSASFHERGVRLQTSFPEEERRSGHKADGDRSATCPLEGLSLKRLVPFGTGGIVKARSAVYALCSSAART